MEERVQILENIIAEQEGKDLQNDLHLLVKGCLLETTPDVFKNAEQTKEDLDYDEYLETKKKYET